MARGRARGQADPAAVCFLPPGLLPKANKPGWENEADSGEREMPGRVLGPGTSGLPGKGCAGAPFPAGDPEGAKPQTGRGPQTGTPGSGKTLHAASGNNMSGMHLNTQVLCAPFATPGAWVARWPQLASLRRCHWVSCCKDGGLALSWDSREDAPVRSLFSICWGE